MEENMGYLTNLDIVDFSKRKVRQTEKHIWSPKSKGCDGVSFAADTEMIKSS